MMVYQNSICGSFLKVCCDVESEILILLFLYPVSVHWSILPFEMDLLSLCDFCSIMHWSLMQLPDVDTFHHLTSKTHVC